MHTHDTYVFYSSAPSFFPFPIFYPLCQRFIRIRDSPLHDACLQTPFPFPRNGQSPLFSAQTGLFPYGALLLPSSVLPPPPFFRPFTPRSKAFLPVALALGHCFFVFSKTPPRVSCQEGHGPTNCVFFFFISVRSSPFSTIRPLVPYRFSLG